MDVFTNENNAFELLCAKGGIRFLFDSQVNKMLKLSFNTGQVSKMYGIEVLRKTKHDPYREIMPVVVFASSKEQRDTIEPYIRRRQCLPFKPVEHGQSH